LFEYKAFEKQRCRVEKRLREEKKYGNNNAFAGGRRFVNYEKCGFMRYTQLFILTKKKCRAFLMKYH